MDESVQDFLKDVDDGNRQDQNDLLNQELPGAPKAAQEPEKEEEPRNRAERRERSSKWEQRISQRERDLIEREARLKAVEEIQRASAPQDVPNEWLQMWGDKPETRQAWALQQKLDQQREERLRESIRQDLVKEQEEQARAVARDEEELDEYIDHVEDSYAIDMTSNTPAARKALELYMDALRSVSHKNENGEVDAYGDPDAAFEIYKARRERENSNSKNKDLASRSIAPSSQADISKLQDDAMREYLRSEGIRV